MIEPITSIDSLKISEAKKQSRKSKAAAYAEEQKKSRENPEENTRVNQSDKNFKFKRECKNYLMEVVACILRYVITFDVTKPPDK